MTILDETINKLMRDSVNIILNVTSTIRANQKDLIRPKGPYADVHVSSDLKIGWEERNVENEGDFDLKYTAEGLREITVTFNFYRSTENESALDRARKVHIGFARETINETWKAAKVGLLDRTEVLSADETIEDGWEDRASFDITLSAVGTDEEIICAINEVLITGVYEYADRQVPINIAVPEQEVAPSFVTDPVLSGDAYPGGTISTTRGVATGTLPITYTIEFLMNGIVVQSGASLTYVVQPADLGKIAEVRSTATNNVDSDQALSNQLTIVEAPSAPEFTQDPTISGSGNIGELVTATPGIVTGNPTPVVTRQWYFEPTEVIVGETGLTYTPQAGDEGKELYYEETATSIEGVATASSNRITIASGVVWSPLPHDPDFGVYKDRASTQALNWPINQIRRSSDNDVALIGNDGVDTVDGYSYWTNDPTDPQGGVDQNVLPLSSWGGDAGLSGDTITDSSNSVTQNLNEVTAIDSGAQFAEFRFDVETLDSNIIHIDANLTGGATNFAGLDFDPVSGGYEKSGVSFYGEPIISKVGNKYTISIFVENTGSNSNMLNRIYPAYRATLGGAIDVTLTGSIDVTGILINAYPAGLRYNSYNGFMGRDAYIYPGWSDSSYWSPTAGMGVTDTTLTDNSVIAADQISREIEYGLPVGTFTWLMKVEKKNSVSPIMAVQMVDEVTRRLNFYFDPFTGDYSLGINSMNQNVLSITTDGISWYILFSWDYLTANNYVRTFIYPTYGTTLGVQDVTVTGSLDMEIQESFFARNDKAYAPLIFDQWSAQAETVPAYTSWTNTGFILAGDTITDNDTSTSARLFYSQYAKDADSAFSLKFHLDYEDDETVFPNFRIQFTGASTRNKDISISKKTGEYVINDAFNSTIVKVSGNTVDGWDVEIYTEDGVSNTNVFVYFWPAYSATNGGAEDRTLTGAITVPNADIEINEWPYGFGFSQGTELNQPLALDGGSVITDNAKPMDSGLLLPNGDNFTIGCIFKANQLFDGTNFLFGFGDEFNQDFKVFSTTSLLAFRADPGNQTASVAKTSFDDDKKHFLVCAYDSSDTLKVYLDGSEITTGGSITGTISFGNYSLKFSGSAVFDHVFTDLQNTWTAQQVLDNYNWFVARGAL